MPLTIRIDRTKKPTYPENFKILLNPGLERQGPQEYELSSLNLWLHTTQQRQTLHFIKPLHVYQHLKEHGMLPTCLTLLDGQALLEQVTPAAFLKQFGKNSPALWGSVIELNDGRIQVPYIQNNFDSFYIAWMELRNDIQAPAFKKHNPAFRFQS